VLVLLLTATLTLPAFAITEAEVEAQVSATSREAVTGNVLIWFLCAIAFLKVSQKIDSFMASLGVNVGHTGGSMLAEAMIATRGVATAAALFGGSGGGRSGGGSSGSSGVSGFLKGGLAGVVSRKVTNDAVKTATTATSAVNTVKSTAKATATQTNTAREQQSAITRQTNTQTGTHQNTQTEAAHTASSQTITQMSQQSELTASQVFQQAEQAAAIHQVEQSNVQSAHQSEHTAQQTSTQTTAHSSQNTSTATRTERQTASAPAFKGVGLGGAIFAKSLLSGGSFANDVIGTVAKGDIRSTGSITGDLAAQSLQSYLGYAGEGSEGKASLSFSNVEIGGGRITGMVSRPDMAEPVAFGMYHAEQYTEPKGDFSRIRSADGTLWYTQLAQDAVERKPYKATDDTVAYEESIVKRLPDPPRRKDRI